jgi:hypothetical protein
MNLKSNLFGAISYQLSAISPLGSPTEVLRKQHLLMGKPRQSLQLVEDPQRVASPSPKELAPNVASPQCFTLSFLVDLLGHRNRRIIPRFCNAEIKNQKLKVKSIVTTISIIQHSIIFSS